MFKKFSVINYVKMQIKIQINFGLWLNYYKILQKNIKDFHKKIKFQIWKHLLKIMSISKKFI